MTQKDKKFDEFLFIHLHHESSNHPRVWYPVALPIHNKHAGQGMGWIMGGFLIHHGVSSLTFGVACHDILRFTCTFLSWRTSIWHPHLSYFHEHDCPGPGPVNAALVHSESTKSSSQMFPQNWRLKSAQAHMCSSAGMIPDSSPQIPKLLARCIQI